MDQERSLKAELLAEAAASLGIAGKRLEAALAVLAAVDAGEPAPDGMTRSALVDDAARRAWEYVVQRGALGWHDEQAALAVFAVPAEVRRRMGVQRR